MAYIKDKEKLADEIRTTINKFNELMDMADGLNVSVEWNMGKGDHTNQIQLEKISKEDLF